jgi:hypothetical protein
MPVAAGGCATLVSEFTWATGSALHTRPLPRAEKKQVYCVQL